MKWRWSRFWEARPMGEFYRASADPSRTKGGESIFSVTSADGYVEQEPTVADWFRDIAPGRTDIINYVTSLFPAAGWLPRYNLRWFVGDVIAGESSFKSLIASDDAGITVG